MSGFIRWHFFKISVMLVLSLTGWVMLFRRSIGWDGSPLERQKSHWSQRRLRLATANRSSGYASLSACLILLRPYRLHHSTGTDIRSLVLCLWVRSIFNWLTLLGLSPCASALSPPAKALPIMALPFLEIAYLDTGLTIDFTNSVCLQFDIKASFELTQLRLSCAVSTVQKPYLHGST